jgi:DNA polymerase III delta prime subunit
MALLLHQNILDKLNYFHNSNQIPNIIFHGPSGSGKTKLITDFLHRIYKNDKQKMKSNIMSVNCSHGKGIKFIREDLKFFAKANLQSTTGVQFKSIVMYNADSLTNDAQSALRRCIELFSFNTRFFIVVENKHKLLNPIVSRFCEIYVPEHIDNGKVVNLHKYGNQKTIDFTDAEQVKSNWIQTYMNNRDMSSNIAISNACIDIYEKGYSCVDIIDYMDSSDIWSEMEKANTIMCFQKIKGEFRSEKLLLMYMLNFMYLRENTDLYCISFM